MPKAGNETTEKALAERQASALAATPEYGDEAGAGFEGQTGDDIVLPFLGVLQALSPQVGSEADGGLPDAKAGMLFNTVTNELFDARAGIEFVPAHVEHCFVEWIPRKQGGGFVAVHPLDYKLVGEAREKTGQKFGKFSTAYNDKGEPIGNDLVETYYVYGIVVKADGNIEPAVIALTSTKITVYKHWNTQMQMFRVPTKDGRKIQPPLYAHSVRIASVSQKNSRGTFFNFSITPARGNLANSLLQLDDPRFQAAKDLRNMVKGGATRLAFDSQNADGGEQAAASEEKAPF